MATNPLIHIRTRGVGLSDIAATERPEGCANDGSGEARDMLRWCIQFGMPRATL